MNFEEGWKVSKLCLLFIISTIRDDSGYFVVKLSINNCTVIFNSKLEKKTFSHLLNLEGVTNYLSSS